MTAQSLCSDGAQLMFKRHGSVLQVPDRATFLVWMAFQQGFSVEEINAALSSEAASAECQRDAAILHKEWMQMGLLDFHSSGCDLGYQVYSHTVQPALERVRLTTNDSEIHAYLRKLYPAVEGGNVNDAAVCLGVVFSAENGTYTIQQDNQQKAICRTFDDAVITAAFLLGEIATHEEPRLLVCHAAVLRKGDIGVLMPAEAGKGKSTLTAFLLRQGFKLGNDDIAPLNFDGTVSAIQQPLKVKSGSWVALSEDYPALNGYRAIARADGLIMKHMPVEVGKCCGAGERIRVNLIVIPEYDPKQDKVCVYPLGPTERLQYLLGSKPFFPHPLTRPYLQKILDWLGEIPAYKIVYNDGKMAIDVIDSLVKPINAPV